MSEAYRRAGIQSQVMPFLYDMPAALRAADLVVARAGAMTVAELTACGKPAILIPLAVRHLRPSDAECQGDGSSRGRRGASASRADGGPVGEHVAAILRDPDDCERWARAVGAMRRIDAAEVIVRECYAPHGGNIMM